jgi:cytoskeletal protein RodZ
VFAIGSSLREARERQGIELVDAEASTKVRAKYLRALEDEAFDVLPAQTYVKGFLRAYADYLGLDGQVYVDEFNSRFASGDDDLPTVTRPRRSRAGSGRQVETSVVLVALAGIAAVTALVVVAWKWGGSPKERPAVLSPPAAPQASGRSKPTQAEWPRLQVRAVRGDSWIRVVRLRSGSATGKQLFRDVLARGQERSFVGQRLRLLVQSPENLAFWLEGKRVRLPADSHSLTVTRRGVRAT